MSIHFRKMTEQDVPAVSGLEKRLFSRPWSEQSLLQALCQSTLFVVALERNVVVGYCGMYCAFQEGEIMNVAVDPAWQGQGIGREMMSRFLGLARSQGISRIILEVRVSNHRAIRLYTSLGFQSCGIRRNLYDRPLEDGIVMQLEML